MKGWRERDFRETYRGYRESGWEGGEGKRLGSGKGGGWGRGRGGEGKRLGSGKGGDGGRREGRGWREIQV